MNYLKRFIPYAFIALLLSATALWSATIVKPNTFVSGTPTNAAAMNANFDTIYSDYNGNINGDNILDGGIGTADIANGAITSDKLAFGANVSVDTAIGTSDISTTDTSFAVMTDPTYTDTFVACNIYATFSGGIKLSGNTAWLQLLVDGVAVDTIKLYNTAAASPTMIGVLSWAGAVTAASHTISMKWKTDGSYIYIDSATNGTKRKLTILRGLN